MAAAGLIAHSKRPCSRRSLEPRELIAASLLARMRGPMIRVLIVEDEPTVRRAIARALGSHGWAVEQAGSVGRAVELIAQGVFDCAILDIDLPDGTGVELAKRLQQAGRTERVIFFSGASDPELLAEASRLATSVHKSEGVDCLVEVAVRELRDLPRSQACVRSAFTESEAPSGSGRPGRRG